jgi:hypothetical protein
MTKKKELPWIDDIAGTAVEAMAGIADYAIDILTLGLPDEKEKGGWHSKWERSGDDGTYDYIPGCFDVIRWLIDAIADIHNFETESFENGDFQTRLPEMAEKFRETHPLDEVYWTADGVSDNIAEKALALIKLLGYPESEIAETGLEPDDESEESEDDE